MAATGGAETAYFFDEHEFTPPPFSSGVRVSQSLVFCEFFFVSFSFDRYIVYIPRIMAFGYAFGIFKLSLNSGFVNTVVYKSFIKYF